MKLLVDAMPASYGGIAVWTENVIAGWVQQYPQDEVHVVVPQGSDWWPLPAQVHRHDVRFPAWAWIARPLVLSLRVPRLAAELGADAILAVNPATVLRRSRQPLAVVTHDLRHELRPEQFPFHRRILRTLSHRHGVRTADLVIAVSERTAGDLRRACPDVADRILVVPEGSDHVDRWTRGQAHGQAVAFAHHTNKNLDMVLEAWAAAPDLPNLLVLGLGRVAGRDEVSARVASLGLSGRVELAPYLDAEEFQRTMTGARLIVFPSDFEGFGLPVIEAMRLRVPVVIGPEPACLEVAGGHASVLAQWTAASLVDASRTALSFGASALDAAREHADGFTWTSTAAAIRSGLVDLGSARS